MDEVLIFILILVPGLIAIMARKYFKKRKRKKLAGYEDLYYMAVHGFVVFGMLSVFNYNVFDITSISELLEAMDYLPFFFFYSGSSAVVAVLWILIWEKFGSEWLNWIRNRLLKKTEGVKVTTNPTVWDEIFCDKDNAEEWKIVSIFRGDKLIISGIIVQNNAPDADVMEFRLTWSTQIKEILEADEEKERQEDKVLNVVKFDYYNADTDLLIRFYDPRKLKERKVLDSYLK